MTTPQTIAEIEAREKKAYTYDALLDLYNELLQLCKQSQTWVAIGERGCLFGEGRS